MDVPRDVIVIAFIMIVALIAIYQWHLEQQRSTGPSKERRVGVSEIAKIFAALDRDGRDQSFAALVFPLDGREGGPDMVNIQFSKENGSIGLDWVLESVPNRSERERFEGIVASHGRRVHLRQRNGVEYLRVEGEGLAPLCLEVIEQIGGLSKGDSVSLIADPGVPRRASLEAEPN